MSFNQDDVELDRRSMVSIELSENIKNAIQKAANHTFETMPLAPHERHTIYNLLGIILDGKTPDGRSYTPRTLAAMAADMRRGVDIAKMYGDDLYEIAYRIVRPAYQAGLAEAARIEPA